MVKIRLNCFAHDSTESQAIYRGMMQRLAILAHNQKVVGSNPTPATNCWRGSMAEQLTCNEQVVGSTPIASSRN